MPFHQFSLIMQDNYKGPNAELAIDMLFNCFYFTDLQWIAHKVEALSSTHLLYDILAAEELVLSSSCHLNRAVKTQNNVTYVMLNTTNDNELPKTYLHIEFLKGFLQCYHSILDYDGQQFLTLFKYHIRMQTSCQRASDHCPGDDDDKDDKDGGDDGGDRRHPSNVDELRNDEKIRSWLEYLHEIEQPMLDIISRQFHMHPIDAMTTDWPLNLEKETATINYDALHYLPHKGNFVASISNQRQEIAIWDALSCKRVRLLQGVPQPIAMCPFGVADAAVLCRREIKIFNLDEGQLKVTISYVKIPFVSLTLESFGIAEINFR